MSNIRKLLLKYGITTVVAGGMSLLILELRGYSDATPLVEKYRILADAFTIPGVLLVMVAALIWISSEGFFDSFGYAARQFGHLFIPLGGKERKHQTYYDYKMEKADKRAHGYAFLFFVGLVFVIVSVVFVLLHSSIYVPSV